MHLEYNIKTIAQWEKENLYILKFSHGQLRGEHRMLITYTLIILI